MERLADRERRIAGLCEAGGLVLGRVFCYDEVGSTMDAAFAIDPVQLYDRTLVVADVQRGGRGRFDRAWYSAPGDLTFSLVLTEYNFECPHAMVAALAVFRALGAYVENLRLKWVNDVLAGDGRKLAGVLVEERTGRTVIGIGVNLNARELPPRLADTATSLYLQTGRQVPMEELLLGVLGELVPLLERCRRGGLAEVLGEWEECSGIRGRTVCVRSGERELTGIVTRLNRENGALVLDVDGEEVELYEGSLSELGPG